MYYLRAAIKIFSYYLAFIPERYQSLKDFISGQAFVKRLYRPLLLSSVAAVEITTSPIFRSFSILSDKKSSIKRQTSYAYCCLFFLVSLIFIPICSTIRPPPIIIIINSISPKAMAIIAPKIKPIPKITHIENSRSKLKEFNCFFNDDKISVCLFVKLFISASNKQKVR